MAVEVHQGGFPAWYAPVQLVVLPVDAGQDGAADWFAADARVAGLRVEVDRAGSLGARIRDAARVRVPYAAVIGPREAADGRIALRLRDGRTLDPMPAAEALALITGRVGERSHDLLPGG